ncbi:hypothetical protein LMG27177_00910 [Paraburkholderia fynbosensis]|uniref:Uncharacterized protein n=1 Tax=Paraburkholderia fynbosensis TaxID=1200993 RepID=A0A6J5FLU6_9BURK|nr:hypothetical protein LMG27177_00910 [Paraburkholderia fynbosensis]
MQRQSTVCLSRQEPQICPQSDEIRRPLPKRKSTTSANFSGNAIVAFRYGASSNHPLIAAPYIPYCARSSDVMSLLPAPHWLRVPPDCCCTSRASGCRRRTCAKHRSCHCPPPARLHCSPLWPTWPASRRDQGNVVGLRNASIRPATRTLAIRYSDQRAGLRSLPIRLIVARCASARRVECSKAYRVFPAESAKSWGAVAAVPVEDSRCQRLNVPSNRRQ